MSLKPIGTPAQGGSPLAKRDPVGSAAPAKIWAANVRTQVFWLVGLVVLTAIFVVMAFQVRSDFGKVDVTFVSIPAPDGHLVTARLYRPVWATATNKLPAVLAMHGGNNDKDTQSPTAIELARRGFVVLASDADGPRRQYRRLCDVSDGGRCPGFYRVAGRRRRL